MASRVKIGALLGGMAMRQIVTASRALLPILLLVALSVWLRLLPDQLEAANQWAWQNVRRQVAEQLDPRLPAAQREAALDRLLRNNRQVVAETQAELAEAFRRDVSFIGEDGQSHLFLGGDDSYYFLRQARDILRHGSLCPAIRDGQCFDTFANAPLGRVVDKPYSIHPIAIAALHRVLEWFIPGLPLTVSATLLATLLAVAAVPLIFLMLRRLLTPAAGSEPFIPSLAALLGTGIILLNLPLIGRSVAGDNDIWVALLPALTALLLCVGLEREGRFRLPITAAAGGLLLGLLAGSWGGWHLFAVIFLVSLGGLMLHGLLGYAFRRHGLTDARRYGLALLVLMVTMALVALPLSGSLEIAQGLQDIIGALGFGRPQSLRDAIPEANAFVAVSELQKVPVVQIGDYFGPAGFLLGLIGPLLGLLPSSWPRVVRLAALLLIPVVLLSVGWAWSERGFRMLAFAVAAMAAPLMLLHARNGDRPPVLALLTAIWLFAALMLSHEGQRYLLMLGTPLGLGIALAVVFLSREVWPFLAGRLPMRIRILAGIAAALVLLIGIGLPALAISANEARFQVPRMNRAWADVLNRIRQQARPDAVVATWWDYGHFVSYLAERPVVVDGASLRYTTVHWIGRVLAAADPAEARGLLRMLACGGTPQGIRPYEALLDAGLDRAQALSLITAVVRADRNQAQALLDAARLPPALSGMVLRHTHCDGPPQILVTTNALLRIPAWALSGFWNPDLAWLVETVRQNDEVVMAARRLGLSGPGLTALMERAKAARSDIEKARVAAPGAEIWSTAWHPCKSTADGQLSCTLNLRSADGMLLHSLVFDPATPNGLSIDATHPQGMSLHLQPQLIRVALPDRLLDFTPPNGVELAVIVEPAAQRVFVSSPAIARSLLVRLALLEGRYDTDWLDKFTEASSVNNNETVSAWQIR